jgi:hypothetical protein
MERVPSPESVASISQEQAAALRLAEARYKMPNPFTWRAPRDIYNELLESDLPQQLGHTPQSILRDSALHRQLYRISINNRGLRPLGLYPLDFYPRYNEIEAAQLYNSRDIVSEPLFHQRWVSPVSSQTLEPEVGPDPHTRTVNEYVLSLAWARLDTPRHLPRLTIAVKRPEHEVRRPGAWSPLYDAATGLPSEDPTLFTAGGEPLWSKQPTSLSEFQSAVHEAVELLNSPDELEILSALVPTRKEK